jgi:Two component regulator propeller
MMNSRHIYKLILAILFTSVASAQDRPIGYWRSHLPYNVGVGIATDGRNIAGLCEQAFFTLDGANPFNPAETYSKVEGMSDIGMKCVGYDTATSTWILIYTNGNIDLFKENQNTFYNIPDLNIKSVSGDKTVNMVYAENGVAYLSTSIGILVIDLTTHNITETYQFNVNNQNVPVMGFTGCGTYYYAIAKTGLYRAAKNNPQLQNFQVWTQVDTNTSLTNIASVNNQLFVSNSKSVFGLVSDTLKLGYTCTAKADAVLQHIDAGINGILISEFYTSHYYGKIRTMDLSLNLTDSFVTGNPWQAVQLSDGSIWVADNYAGIQRLTAGGYPLNFIPAGPAGAYSYDIYANNKDLWIAHGKYDEKFRPDASRAGVSNWRNDKWTLHKASTDTSFINIDRDFVALAKDETNGTMYMGSFMDGLYTLYADGTHEVVNNNSIFDISTICCNGTERQLVGLALDKDNNLWVTAFGANYQLYEKTKADGIWHRYRIPGSLNGGPIVIDDFGQVWFMSFMTGGVVCFNPKLPVYDSLNVSNYYHFVSGVGTGNLPSNKVTAIAKDFSNSIWVGTDDGICIISNCSIVDSVSTSCDAQIPIVQYDQFAGYLFAGNVIRSIAVDGANRKWVGTDDGVWLLSPNAQKIIYRFTVANSPLPSNLIRKITVDKVTGDVYIGTDMGLVSYRSTATDGTVADNHCIEIFPNPVPGGYGGTIGIKGLPPNSDVRITDINGQLVYKTTALGGQAVWNGIDYKGHRPQSGVYLVFVTNADGSQHCTGKIVFIQ